MRLAPADEGVSSMSLAQCFLTVETHLVPYTLTDNLVWCALAKK